MVTWPDSVDAILTGDQAVALVYATPAKGAVVMPLTNFGVRDREAGTVTVNSSVGAWKKLERIRRNPKVALAYHTREHGFNNRPEYVLLQGTATLLPPDPDYPATLGENWERFVGPVSRGPIWEPWLRVYHTRVGIEVAVSRAIVWPDLSCSGAPVVHGAPAPGRPPGSQNPPTGGTRPRINHRGAATKIEQLPHVLLGWIDASGFPIAVPVKATGSQPSGIVLEACPGLVPEGGRRAGLTAHAFTRYVLGQDQRVHTGWLDAQPGSRELLYSPHTKTGHRFPPSKLLYNLLVGFGTRLWQRGRPAPQPR